MSNEHSVNGTLSERLTMCRPPAAADPMPDTDTRQDAYLAMARHPLSGRLPASVN